MLLPKLLSRGLEPEPHNKDHLQKVRNRDRERRDHNRDLDIKVIRDSLNKIQGTKAIKATISQTQGIKATKVVLSKDQAHKDTKVLRNKAIKVDHKVLVLSLDNPLPSQGKAPLNSGAFLLSSALPALDYQPDDDTVIHARRQTDSTLTKSADAPADDWLLATPNTSEEQDGNLADYRLSRYALP